MSLITKHDDKNISQAWLSFYYSLFFHLNVLFCWNHNMKNAEICLRSWIIGMTFYGSLFIGVRNKLNDYEIILLWSQIIAALYGVYVLIFRSNISANIQGFMFLIMVALYINFDTSDTKSTWFFNKIMICATAISSLSLYSFWQNLQVFTNFLKWKILLYLMFESFLGALK